MLVLLVVYGCVVILCSVNINDVDVQFINSATIRGRLDNPTGMSDEFGDDDGRDALINRLPRFAIIRRTENANVGANVNRAGIGGIKDECTGWNVR